MPARVGGSSQDPDITPVIERLRRPEYTGRNRCTPCTVVNVVLTLGADGALALVSLPLGAVSLMAGLGAVYLRGYLVPGTPTLTKRDLPERALRYFEHDTGPLADDDDAPSLVGEGDEIDPEPVLRTIGAIEPYRNDTDPCLTDEFATA